MTNRERTGDTAGVTGDTNLDARPVTGRTHDPGAGNGITSDLTSDVGMTTAAGLSGSSTGGGGGVTGDAGGADLRADTLGGMGGSALEV